MASIKNASAQVGKPDKKINNACLPNLPPYLAAGINPKTGLPFRAPDPIGEGFKENNKKLLRIIDEQDAVNRFEWYNLPEGLSGVLIERILYYRGQGILFYMADADRFYFLPYALNGTIDVYGRYTEVTPYPFNGTATDGKEGDKAQPWIQGLNRKCVYDIQLDELQYEKVIESCVILNDYTPQISQTVIARSIMNDPLLDVMADCIPFLHTALLNGTGVMGMRVQGEDDYSNVAAASDSINHCARSGQKFVPIIGTIDFQQLTGGPVSKAEEFLLAMQSLDNYRLSLYGLENGGLFQKKSHILEAEQNMNAGKASLVMQDSLMQRQNFCDIVNSLFGLGIWCEISESAIGLDKDFDGEISENDPQTVGVPSNTTTPEGESDNE